MKAALQLGEEIEKRQVSTRGDTDTDINAELRVDEATLSHYASFSDQGYKLLKTEINSAKEETGEATCTEECLTEVIQRLKTCPRPLYR